MSKDPVEKMCMAKTKAMAAQVEGRLLLQEILGDANAPLFDRWCLFMAHGDLFLPKSQWGLDDGVLVEHITDQMDLDRYREYSFSQEIFEESWVHPEQRSNENYASDYASAYTSFSEIPEDIVLRVLHSGVSGFTHDW